MKRGFRKPSATPACVITKKLVSIDKVRKISPSLLSKSVHLGEGKFGVCVKAFMQGSPVCIKEHRRDDSYGRQVLLHEASILSELCHQSVCFLWGIQIECAPYCIVLNLYAVDGFSISICDVLYMSDNKSTELVDSPKQCVVKSVHETLNMHMWFRIMTRIVEGLLYIHKLDIIHRDLKADNVVFYGHTEEVQPVIVDFGKSEYASKVKKYVLTELEKLEYKKRYKHIAPDLVDGITKPGTASDIYSFGRLFKSVICYFPLNVSELDISVKESIKACLKYDSVDRPTSTCIIDVLNKLCNL